MNRELNTNTPTNPIPILNPNGTVTIGPIKVGVWATDGKQYRFAATEGFVKPFNKTTAKKLVTAIADIYEVTE